MNVALEILFVLLVLADMGITYAVLESGKGKEKKYWQINWPIKFKLPTLMGFLINYPAGAISVTMLAVAALFAFLYWAEGYFEIPAFLILIPASGAFVYAIVHNWKVLHA